MTLVDLLTLITRNGAYGSQTAVVLSLTDWTSIHTELRQHMNEKSEHGPVLEASIPRENFLLRGVPVFCRPDAPNGKPEFTTLVKLDLPESTGVRFRGDYL